MNSSTICSLFLGLILIYQSPFAATATHLDLGGGGPVVVSLLCGDSSKNVECHKVLSIPQTAQAKNYRELSKAITEIAIKKVVEGEAFLKGLAQKSKSKELNICADSYSGIVRDLHNCLDYIDGDLHTIRYDCLLASDKLSHCKTVNPAVTALNSQISLFCYLIFQSIDQLPNYTSDP